MKLLMLSLLLIAGTAEARRYTWVEEGREHEVYLVPNRTAEIKGGVKIVHVSKENFQRSLQQGFAPNQSPVFSETPQGTGLRTLPGGVLVTFPSRVTEQQVSQWARNHGVEIEKPVLQIGKRHIWQMRSGAGIPSLDLANRLSDADGVASVSPNWWLDLQPR